MQIIKPYHDIAAMKKCKKLKASSTLCPNIQHHSRDIHIFSSATFTLFLCYFTEKSKRMFKFKTSCSRANK